MGRPCGQVEAVSKRQCVAILGAGMAGATAARSLAEAGLTVRVFDKGRGVGGRMATRRNAAMQFDHGAQFLRAHGHAFARRVEDWTLRGVVSPWAGAGRSVGVPGMTAPVRDLLTGLSVASATTITRICRNGTEWHLVDASGAVHGPFGALGITFPAPQVAALLDESHVALHGLARVSYAPCWSLMVALDVAVMESLLEPREDPVGLIALDSSKPGRPDGVRLVVHATADWSRRNLEEPREAVAATLSRAAGLHLSTALRPLSVDAHRWRYAQVESALGLPCLYDPAMRLGAAGDWCLGARIEAAHDSGLSLAEAMLADLGGSA